MAMRDEEAWLDEFRGPDPGGTLGPGWREWLHDLFSISGPVALEEVKILAVLAQQGRAKSAADLVATDVRETLGERIEVSTMVDNGAVRVVVDGQIANLNGLFSVGIPELIVEVADAIQDEVMQDGRVWPECPTHNAGLHPELDGGRAAWICRVGRHQVAPIGELRGMVRKPTKASKRKGQAR
jgi:hypothetical protein